MDASDISLTNFTYRGGDDCIAIKPRSYRINVQNVTCIGGNGVAIGSLGQYLEDSSVEDVVFDGVSVCEPLATLGYLFSIALTFNRRSLETYRT
jgi:galacturan 1,4-alpha-galacturonidase